MSAARLLPPVVSIILAFPGAALFNLDGEGLAPVAYRDTKHFLISRDFLNAPERFFKHLFETPAPDPAEAPE